MSMALRTITRIQDADDVTFGAPTDGYALVWDATSQRWQVSDTVRAGLFRVATGSGIERIDTPLGVFDGEIVRNGRWQRLFFVDGINGLRESEVWTAGRTTKTYLYQVSGDSPALFLWQLSGSTVYLARSASGTGAWTDVLSYTGSTPDTLPHILCDCGTGRMILVDYGITGTRVWGSADYGQTWGDNAPDYDDGDPLITAGAGIITHFHGAVYDSVTDALVIMTGDANSGSRMLYCDDIDSLFASPDVWKTRWGLDSAGQAITAAYCLNDNLVSGLPTSQKYRAVSAVFATVDSTRYIVWGVDGASAGGQTVWKQDITAGAGSSATAVGTGVIGATWLITQMSTGDIIVATDSEYSGSSPYPGHDAYLHLYAINDQLTYLDEVAKFERVTSSGSAVWYSLFEFADHLIAFSSYLAQPTVICSIGQMKNAMASTGTEMSNYALFTTPVPKFNIIKNSRVAADTANWSALHTVLTRVTSGAPTGEIAYLKITPDAGETVCSAYQALSALERGMLAGQLVTLSFLYKANGALGTQKPAVQINYGTSRGVTCDAFYLLANTSDVWTEKQFTVPVPSGASAMQIHFYATYYAAHIGLDLCIANVALCVGTTAPRRLLCTRDFA